MATPKHVIRQARSIRKLITSLVADEFNWTHYYYPFISWHAHINVSKEQALLILSAVQLLGVETRTMDSYFISDDFTVKVRMNYLNGNLRVVFVCHQFTSWASEDTRGFFGNKSSAV